MRDMRHLLLFVALLGSASVLPAQAPRIYARDGQYLGTLSANKYDPDSISNPYGTYGSKYSPYSINNPYSIYGSRYSPYSPRNPYTFSAPVIISPSTGYGYSGYLGYSSKPLDCLRPRTTDIWSDSSDLDQ